MFLQGRHSSELNFWIIKAAIFNVAGWGIIFQKDSRYNKIENLHPLVLDSLRIYFIEIVLKRFHLWED